MHIKLKITKDLSEILLNRRVYIFDLPLRERLILLRHLMPRDII